jgi:fibro-slime domain-containing protein
VDLADVAGVAGAAGNGQVTSALTFSEWFEDVLGVNQSAVHTIGLVDDGTGVYEYLDDQFYPIDGILLGNEGATHNENFTFAFTTQFKYEACAGQFATAQGGDGLWIFIDGTLVIDLAGVDYAADQYIDLDRLGLSDGQVYEMGVFYASRNSDSPVFNFRTNVALISEEPPFNVTGVAD